MVQNLDPNSIFETAFKMQNNGSPRMAIPLYQSILDMKPTNRQACSIINSNIGLCWMDLEEWEKAIQSFDQAIKWEHNWSHQWHKCISLLHSGKWDEGMLLYFSRYMQEPTQTSVRLPMFPIQHITNPQTSGNAVLVMGEQGLGDQIMFSSVLPLLQSSWQKVVVNISKELVELFQYLYKDQKWIEFCNFEQISAENITKFDGFIMLGDLFSWIEPQTLYTTDTEIGNQNGPIGWCWHTNRISPNSNKRSLDKDLIKTSNKEWKSLQYGEDHNLNVLETWDLLDQLSEVWTCDSFIAHLAGMKGIKTTLIVNEYWDWRWKLVDQNMKSILYPNIQIKLINESI